MRVFVSGVSRGIGAETALLLIKAGHEVWGAARSEHAGFEHPNLHYSRCDVRRDEDIAAVMEAMRQAGFFPDAVILNAGIEKPDTAGGFDFEVGREIMDTNYTGAMRFVDLFLKFPKRPRQFLAVSTVFTRRPNELSVSYGASKAALSMAFRSLRQQFPKGEVSFKIIYFAAVATLFKPQFAAYMGKNRPFYIITASKAARFVEKALQSAKEDFYPQPIERLFLALTSCLPDRWFLKLISPFRR